MTSFLYKLLLIAVTTLIAVQAVRLRFKSLFRDPLLIPSLLVLLSFAAYLFFPDAVTQAWFLNQRFAVFAWLFLIPLAALIAGENRRLPRLAMEARMMPPTTPPPVVLALPAAHPAAQRRQHALSLCCV